jgi:hypothetical protein
MRLGKATKPIDEPFGGKVRRHAYRQDARLLPLHKARRARCYLIERVADHGKILVARLGNDEPMALAIKRV